MRPFTSTNARFSLFVTILSLFLTVALLVGTAVTIANYVQVRETTTKVAADAFDAALDRINERRLAFFAPVYLMIQILRSNPSLHQDDAGAKEAILRLAAPALRSNP